MIMLFYGSIENYFEGFNINNLNTTYSIQHLLLKYVTSVLVIVKILLFFLLSYYLINFFRFNNSKIKNFILILILLSYFLLFNHQCTYFYSLSWTFFSVLLLVSYFILINKNTVSEDKILIVLFL